jgi:hypothetical protein
MDANTFDNTLGALYSRRPFHPFTVVLVNGDRFEVDHPLALSIREGAGFFWAPGRVPWIFDHESVSQIIGDLVNNTRQDS